jgi:dolichol-phosphate mannosyltransferase
MQSQNNNKSDEIFINTYPQDFVAEFSILMPVHNEQESIAAVVRDIYDKICTNGRYSLEIVLAEDGSIDGTKETIKELSTEINLKAILSSRRKGYAGGIKDGLKFVSAPFVLICDSDGQHRPEDFWELKKILEKEGFRRDLIVSGYRKVRSDAFHRRIISKVFQKLNTIVFDIESMKDITSPFKLMDSKLATGISSQCKFMHESFWTEFVVRAINENVTVLETPVLHSNRIAGNTVVYKKSKLPGIVAGQLVAVMRLKKELTNRNIVVGLLRTRAIKRFISFLLVGASGAGVILLLLWIGTSIFGIHFMISAVIAIESSIIWAFFLNDRITFRDRIRSSNLTSKLRRLARYHLSALSGEALNLLILYTLTTAGLYYLNSELIAILIAFTWNYTLSSKWVWKIKVT